jgi:hypothetical protein
MGKFNNFGRGELATGLFMVEMILKNKIDIGSSLQNVP